MSEPTMKTALMRFEKVDEGCYHRRVGLLAKAQLYRLLSDRWTWKIYTAFGERPVIVSSRDLPGGQDGWDDPEQAAQHCIEWIQTAVASFAELISLLPSQQAELAGRVLGEPT